MLAICLRYLKVQFIDILHFGIAHWNMLYYNKAMNKKYSNKYLIYTGIGLQDVDNLTNSSYFLNETSRYIKKEIMKIDWNDFELTKYSKIVDRIKVEDRDINIIVSGSKEYIENINIGINRLIENLNAKGLRDKINVTINNCYPVKEVLSVKEILDKHDLLLNTSGEVVIDSVFQDYRKVSNI